MDSVIKAYAPAMVVIGVSSLVCASHAATLVDQFHGKTSASDDRSLQTPVKKPTKHRNSPSSVMILEEEVEQEAEEEEEARWVDWENHTAALCLRRRRVVVRWSAGLLVPS